METETTAPERDIVSWDDLDRLIASLAERLAGEPFDLMLAITRGGLVPAGMLAYRLRIRNIVVAAVEFYDDHGQPGPHPTFLQFPADPLLRGQRILVVESIVTVISGLLLTDIGEPDPVSKFLPGSSLGGIIGGEGSEFVLDGGGAAVLAIGYAIALSVLGAVSITRRDP